MDPTKAVKTFGAMGVRNLFDDDKEKSVTTPIAPTATPPTGPPPRKKHLAWWRRVYFTLLGAAITALAGVGGYYVIGRTQPKAPVFDQTWERKMQADIAALDSEIHAAKDAYARQEAFAKSRTISREDDRKETARLNQMVLDLEKRRAAVAADFEAHRPR